MRIAVIAALAATLIAHPALIAPALANDTAAVLAAGGLRFTRTSAIEMVSEDLYVSQTEVRVHYVFRNKTARDVTMQVAFPLPDMRADLQETPLNIPNGMSPNFVNFRTSVDGEAVALSHEMKAMRGGRDVTARLIALGAPLNPLDPAFSAKIARLAPAERDALIGAKLVGVDQIDQGQGWEPYYRPTWDLKTRYYRTQTFPAGKDVVVEHAYAPVVGGTVMSMLSSDELWKQYGRRYKRDYCVDPAFEAAARKLPVQTQERWIGYVLKTGANWAGPIGAFRLVVDKGDSQNLVSFCGQGVQKISPTQFEMRASRFTPRKDLNILILTPNPGP